MQMLIDWIMQIVIFMLIGTIVQFLLPNNVLKKYVNIVIGLLLLLILTKPLLYIFSIPLPTTFDYIERSLFSDDSYVQTTERQITEQKDDIESEQAAYIWNEVREQMIEEAKEPLQREHNVELVDVTIEQPKDRYHVERIIVFITRNDELERENNTLIEQVEVNTINKQTDHDLRAETEQIVMQLAEIWEIDEQLIQLEWERRT
ncbi:MAG TPA: stage III sporulation protein AF [Pseudogracilibacillus sp.]|nr:stage III sporulation protein AF [Pseudogracilibacillus sp.]